MGDKKPKPKLTTAQQNAMLKKSGYKGAGATGKFTNPVVKAKVNLENENAKQKKKYDTESIVHTVKRTFNPLDNETLNDRLKVQTLTSQLQQAKLNARRTAGDTKHVNPINGPIAESHKKAGK